MGKISQQRQAFAEQYIRESVYSSLLQVLSKYGLEGLTVQRVAVAANLATGTLYNYFKDKDALMVYAAVRMFAELRQGQGDAIKQAVTAAKKLQAFIKATFVFFSNNVAFFRFLDQAQVYCKIDMAIKHDHVNEETRLLAEIIEEGIQKGEFKAVSAEKTAVFFHRAMVGTICVNPELGEFDPDKESKSLMKMFITFLT